MSSESREELSLNLEGLLQAAAREWRAKHGESDESYYRLGFILLTGLCMSSPVLEPYEAWQSYASTQYQQATKEEFPYHYLPASDWAKLCDTAVSTFWPGRHYTADTTLAEIAQSLLAVDEQYITSRRPTYLRKRAAS